MSGFWHRHKWTDWAVTDRGVMTFCGKPCGWYLVQERHCHSCGKTEMSDKAEHGGHGKMFCDRQSTLSIAPRRKDGVSA